MYEYVITLEQAKAKVENHKKQRLLNQKEKLNEFLESNYDLFDYVDYEYFASEIGCSIENLLDIATNQTIKRAEEMTLLTEKLRTENFATHNLKFNPFKKQYFKYNEFLDKWHPAKKWQIESEIKNQ